jgi:hypothetical protein
MVGSHGFANFRKKAAFVALMMEAVQTSETLVNSYQSTRRYNAEDSHVLSNIVVLYFPHVPACFISLF